MRTDSLTPVTRTGQKAREEVKEGKKERCNPFTLRLERGSPAPLREETLSTEEGIMSRRVRRGGGHLGERLNGPQSIQERIYSN